MELIEMLKISSITTNLISVMNKLLSGIIILLPLFGSLAQDRFTVYDDAVKNCQPSGKMGASGGSGLSIDTKSTDNPASGSNCMKFTVVGNEAWNGVFFQAGNTWRDGVTDKSKFADLSPYKYLVLYARSDSNYTLDKVGMGEGGETSVEEKGIALNTKWKKIVFELGGLDLKSINGVFLLVFSSQGTVYIDDVHYTVSTELSENDLVFKRRATPPDSNHYHIYTDKWVNGIPAGYMGDDNGSSLKMDDNWKTNPYEGPKCIKFTIGGTKETWRGLDVQYTGGWNVTIEDDTELPDLTEYTKLVFYARSDESEYIINTVGLACGGGFEEGVTDAFIVVGKKWRKYSIIINQANLSRVNTLLRLVLTEGTLYLDEIHLEKGGSKKKKKSRVQFIKQ